MKQMHKRYFTIASHLTALLLAAVLMAAIAAPAFALPVVVNDDGSTPIMVSLGDSYSSGEGVEPFYYSERLDKYTHPDWLAHRSKLSWPGKLQLTDSAGNRITMSKHKAFYSSATKSYDSYNKNNWYFVASSGAVTGSLKGTQTKYFEYDPADNYPTDKGSATLDSQLKVFESIEPGTTDYVTMTMGGNDAHFADVFIRAAINCSFINVNGMQDYLDKLWDEFYNGHNSIKNRLIRAYADIRNAAGKQADIIIAGYPKILPEKGFLIFSKTESEDINRAIVQLNAEIKGIVESCRSDDFKIHFVSVEEAFDGHEIYTGIFKEYINGIEFVRSDDFSQTQIISSYSLHPNARGVKAYAQCVQQCIDEIELQKQQNAPEQNTEPADEPDEALPEACEPSAAEVPAEEVLFESEKTDAIAGESLQIPIIARGNVPLESCRLHFDYDSTMVQIDSVCPAPGCTAEISDTLGEQENTFDVHWSSADWNAQNGVIFYLNATVLTDEQTLISMHAEEAAADNTAIQELQSEPILINDAGDLCTLTADLTALQELEGARVSASEESLCPLKTGAAPLYAQTQLNIQLRAHASQAEICFYKPGYTRLIVKVENICGGETLDITAALEEATVPYPLLTTGDVNGDGCVSELDISLLIAPEIYGAAVSETALCADVNADGLISFADAAMILLAENYGAHDISLTLPCSDLENAE